MLLALVYSCTSFFSIRILSSSILIASLQSLIFTLNLSFFYRASSITLNYNIIMTTSKHVFSKNANLSTFNVLSNSNLFVNSSYSRNRQWSNGIVFFGMYLNSYMFFSLFYFSYNMFFLISGFWLLVLAWYAAPVKELTTPGGVIRWMTSVVI